MCDEPNTNRTSVFRRYLPSGLALVSLAAISLHPRGNLSNTTVPIVLSYIITIKTLENLEK